MSEHAVAAERRDVYQEITDRIVDSIEIGVEAGICHMPETGGDKLVHGGGGIFLPRAE